MASVEQIKESLKRVIDPEIGVNIVDLGLVYDVAEKEGTVHITATLTSPACPLGPMITQDAKAEVGKLEGVKSVEVEITFNPPWSQEMMSEQGKKELQFIRQGI